MPPGPKLTPVHPDGGFGLLGGLERIQLRGERGLGHVFLAAPLKAVPDEVCCSAQVDERRICLVGPQQVAITALER